jgi:hypothetical protein
MTEGSDGNEFLNKFLHLATSLRKRPDELKDEFYDRLPQRYKLALNQEVEDEDVSWREFQRRFLRQAGVLASLVQEERGARSGRAKTAPTTRVSSTPSGSTTKRATTPADPQFAMETIDGKRRFKNPHIRELAREGRCFTCEEKGHSAKECTKAAGDAARVSAVKTPRMSGALKASRPAKAAKVKREESPEPRHVEFVEEASSDSDNSEN